MSDHDALLAAVIAAPADDLPRLVFADYLDESGDADRAEFIRVQIELARRPADDPQRSELSRRERELLSRNRGNWVIPGLRATPQRFRRGFVEVVEIAADELIQSGGRLLDAAPVRHLRVANADRHIAALSQLSGLGRVETLDLANNHLGLEERLERLLSTAPLRSLRRLILRNCRLWSNHIPQLSRTPVAGQIEHLDLSANPLSDVGAELLAATQSLAGLRELVFHNLGQRYDESVHAAGAAALARSGTLTHLRTLALGGHHIGDAGLIDLATSRNARWLTHLDLSQNDLGAIGSAGYEALAGSPNLNRLRTVNLSGARNRVDRLAAEALIGWPRLTTGVRIDLRDCDLSTDARSVLLGSAHADRFDLSPLAEVST
jgi:uncharacterized protein (TIGR02996 family)